MSSNHRGDPPHPSAKVIPAHESNPYDSDAHPPQIQQHPLPPQEPRHQQTAQSRSSLCSSDGFSSSSFESLPLPGQLQRTQAIEFNPPQPQQPRVPEDPGGHPPPLGRTTQKGWDTFRLLPPKPDRRGRGKFWLANTLSFAEFSGTLYISCLQLFKLCTFVALFLLTLGSALLAKSTILLMAAGLGQAGHNVTICPDKIPGLHSSLNFQYRQFFRIFQQSSLHFAKECGQMGMGTVVGTLHS